MMVEKITNEHGITCPIPISEWPNEAEYATYCGRGFIFFYRDEPTYDEESQTWEGFGLGFEAGHVDADDVKCLWRRN